MSTSVARTGRILLVDDEDSLRLTLAANVELEGFEVLEAESAERAIELLSSEHVDLVVSDVRMPGMSGVDLFRYAAERHPDLPVVLMTAFTTETEQLEAIDAGVFAVLAKPIDPDRVVEIIVTALRRPIVLVVDDVERDARTTAEMLRAASLRADSACDAESALEIIGRDNVDVCVIDLVMPDVDGVELLTRIHSADATIAAIVMSGYDVPELMNKAASDGAFCVLRKPLDPREIVRSIARARAEPRTRAPRAAAR